jgi:hypothetical protein
MLLAGVTQACGAASWQEATVEGLHSLPRRPRCVPWSNPRLACVKLASTPRAPCHFLTLSKSRRPPRFPIGLIAPARLSRRRFTRKLRVDC